MQFTEIFLALKIQNFSAENFEFFLFLLGVAALTSTHNLCFGAKIRKIHVGIPLQTPVLLYKSGVYITRTRFPDGRRSLVYNNLPNSRK